MTAGAPPRTPAPGASVAIAEATSLIRAGRNHEAVDLLKRLAIRSTDPDPRADYLLGVAALRSGDLQTAEGAFRRCAAAAPANARAQYGLGRVLQALGDEAGAHQALAAAISADPRLAAASPDLTARNDGNRPTIPAGQGTPARSPLAGHPAGTAAAAGSLAEILDRKSTAFPTPGELAGAVVWQGRSAMQSLVMSAATPFLLLLTPVVLRAAGRALGVEQLRAAAALLSRLALSAGFPLAVVIAVVATANWLMREFVLHEHQLEIWTGLFGHRHVVLWLHEIERPVLVRQQPWQLALNLATLEISSTALPGPRQWRLARKIGHLRLPGIPVRTAEYVAELIRTQTLWERRQMLKNFVANR